MPILNMENYQKNEIEKLSKLVNDLKLNNIHPKLYIITDGEDDRCKTYMRSKLSHGENIGINVEVKTIQTVNELDELLEIAFQENIPTIMQLPIKKELEEYYNNNSLSKILDVDGFFTFQNLIDGDWSNAPCTALGIMNYILEENGLDIDSRNKNIVIFGRGNLCGLPLTVMSVPLFATTTVITSKTKPSTKRQVLKNADVIVLATGVKGSLKMSELPLDRDIYVVNVGTIFENGKLTTELDVDCENDNVWYTPRIKGIGVLTVLSLMENVINFYKKLLTK